MSALPAISLSTQMSSRQIAEVVNARHDNVLQTIRALINGGILSRQETPYVHPQNGRSYTEFLLNFRDTMVVASGYSAELRAAIIDRWLELESEARAIQADDARIAALEARVAALEAPPALPPRRSKPDAATRLSAFIRERGSATRSEILRQLRDLSAAELDTALDRLGVEGHVVVVLRPTGSRPAEVCRWVQ